MTLDRQFQRAAVVRPEDWIPWGAMAGIIATVTVFAVAQGLTYPLLSFILERRGTTPGLIGVSAAMTPLGFIVSAPFLPALARRVGGAQLAILCSLLAALTLIAIAWTEDVWAWMPLRFLLGVFANPLYVLSETWLISITPAPRRGRIMGLYSSIVSGGFAIGPLSLGLVGTHGWPPFLIGIVAFLLCGLIVLAVVPRLPKMPHEGEVTSVGGFFALAPLLLFAVFAAAAFEQILLSLFAVYGATLGSAEDAHRVAHHLFHRRQCRAADFTWPRGRTVRLDADDVIVCLGFAGRLSAVAVDLQHVAHLAARFRLGRGLIRNLHHVADPTRRTFHGANLDRRQRGLRARMGHRRYRGLARDGTGDATDRTSGTAIDPWLAVLCTDGVSDGGETAGRGRDRPALGSTHHSQRSPAAYRKAGHLGHSVENARR